MPTSVLHQKFPFQMLYHKPSLFLDLKVFASLCFVSTLEQHRTKLDPRARKCIFWDISMAPKDILHLIYILEILFSLGM
jgi:hypothetical protein